MTPDPEEKTLTMRRALHIRGGAIDAETGKAIKPFSLIPGYDWGNGSPPTWEYDQAQQVTGASYEITLSTIYPLRVLRVEAEGYLPGISRGFKDDEDTVRFVFKLRRGTWTEGVVHGCPMDRHWPGPTSCWCRPRRPRSSGMANRRTARIIASSRPALTAGSGSPARSRRTRSSCSTTGASPSRRSERRHRLRST